MEITIARQVDVRSNIKKFFDMAYDGAALLVPRKENKNVVIISEKEYKNLERAKRNAEYLAMLVESDKQADSGKVVVKTIEELEKMAE